jgi:threonine synthase
MYFQDAFPPEYNITSDPKLMNAPQLIHPKDLDAVPAPGKPLTGEALDRFVHRVTEEIASLLNLKRG